MLILGRRTLLYLLLALGLVLPTSARADYFAKINQILIDSDGQAEIYATILDRLGQPPSLAALERIRVYFGSEANQYDEDELDIQEFKDSGRGTDYVLILPAYEGFGINNAVVTAEGAGAFQRTHVRETDTAMIFLYGDAVVPFDGDASELGPAFREPDGVARVARPYMLSAIEEAVRYYEELESGRRRVIVLVGTGMDVRLTDATNVEVEGEATIDYDAARREVIREHTTILRRYIEAVENVGARIYAIGYNDARPDYLEVLRALSRKTGGTFRRVTNIGDLSATGGGTGVFGLVGEELDHELVLEGDFTVEAEREYEIWATFIFPDEISQQVLQEVTTPIYYLTVDVFDTRINIIPYLIAVGVILVVAFLLLMVLLAMSRRMKKQKESMADRKALEEKVAAGKIYCPVCYRKMQPDWQSCLFCASGMAPLEEKPQEMLDAEEAQEKLNELDGITEEQAKAAAAVAGSAAAVAFYAQREGKPTCKTCGRVVDPSWPECMFCAAGMAALQEEVQPQAPVGELAKPVAGGGLAAAGASSPQGAPAPQQAGPVKTIAITPGTDACPQCGRPVPPEWTECLYCKAGV